VCKIDRHAEPITPPTRPGAVVDDLILSVAPD